MALRKIDVSDSWTIRNLVIQRLTMGINLSLTNLSGADLSGLNLRNVNFSGANLEGASLENSDLRGANFSHANIRDASLKGARIDGTTDFVGLKFSGGELNGLRLK